jgi:hypothetical protein
MGDVIANIRLYDSISDVRLLGIVVWRGARDGMADVLCIPRPDVVVISTIQTAR